MTRHIAIAEIILGLCFATVMVLGSAFFNLSQMGVMWLAVGYVLAAGILRAVVMGRKT